jgi:nitrate reductase (cytochrome), electron transfer subunit
MRTSFVFTLSLLFSLTTACAQPSKPDATAAAPKGNPAPEIQASGPDLKTALPESDPFGIPTPDSFSYIDPEPEESPVLPRAFKGAPPQINHETLSMLPIRKGRRNNECLSCHDKPAKIGKKPEHGSYPMGRSHYQEHQGKLVLDGSRFLCDQCHVPQADVKPLVENTFKK